MFFDLGQTEYRWFLIRALGIEPKGPAIPKLPTHGIEPRKIEDFFELYLAPQGPQKFKNDGRPQHRASHRIFIICSCGQHVPAGRMRQHYDSQNHRDQRAAKYAADFGGTDA